MRDNSDKFDCNNCKHNFHCDDKGDWPKSVGPASYHIIEIERDGLTLKSKTCLLSLISDRTNTFFKLHKHYEKGVLLVSGGLYEQPAVYLQAMELIDT